MAPKLVVVGGGKMGSALLAGLVAGGWAPVGDLAVSEPDEGQRRRLSDAHPGLLVSDGPVAAESAVLAVKPDVAEAVARTLAAVGITRVLSIVAGLSTARIEDALHPGAVVVRAMPNTPALVGAGVAGMSGGIAATAADLDWAEGILGSVGSVVRLPERQLDAVTGVSGSGPAYIYLVAEALIDAGVTAGLSRHVSQQLVVGTVLGSARMMAETGKDPGTLRAEVTSPGGTTAAAVRTLEFKAVRSAFIEAVAAATERSRQLGR
jgi:pyrroline-5-carboxylate reductase